MIKGSLCHELEVVAVPPSKVWEIYGTIRLADLVVELLPNIIPKIDILEGDGGVGTIMHLTFPPGSPGPKFHKEKFVKIDDEKRVKETVLLEGGYLELGFSSYMIRFEILEKDAGISSIIKTSIEYELDEDRAAIASLATTAPFEAIAEVVVKFLSENNAS